MGLSEKDEYWSAKLSDLKLVIDKDLKRLDLLSSKATTLLESGKVDELLSRTNDDFANYGSRKLPGALFVSPGIEGQRQILELTRLLDEYNKEEVSKLEPVYTDFLTETKGIRQFTPLNALANNTPFMRLLTNFELCKQLPRQSRLRQRVEGDLASVCEASISLTQDTSWSSLTDSKDVCTSIIPTYKRVIDQFEWTSAPKFELPDVPDEELRARLGKGEIAPREEFIPGMTKEKCTITGAAVSERLKFGEMLRAKGKEASSKNEWVDSATHFAQGVHLLEFHKGETYEEAHAIRELYMIFLRNLALACIRLNRWGEALVNVETALEEDKDDPKAQFIKGKALWCLGRLDEAKGTMKQLRLNPYASAEQKNAAVLAWSDMNAESVQSAQKMRKLVQKAQQDGLLCAHDTQGINPAFKSTPKNYDSPKRSVNMFKQTSKVPQSCSFEPPLTLSDFKILLKDALDLYTSPTVSAELEKARLEADYEEKIILMKLRKILPQYLSPLFKAHNIGGVDFAAQSSTFHKCVQAFKLRYPEDQELAGLISACHDSLYSDSSDWQDPMN